MSVVAIGYLASLACAFGLGWIARHEYDLGRRVTGRAANVIDLEGARQVRRFDRAWDGEK